MLSYSENILRTLTGKSSVVEVDEDDLKRLAEKYPYFGSSQFLFAKKLSVDANENHLQAMQKAALHFNDELWMHYNFSDSEKINQPVAGNGEIVLPIEAKDNVEFSAETPVLVTDNFPEVESVTPEQKEIINLDLPSATNETYSDETEKIDEADDEQNERLSNILKEQAAVLDKPISDTELNIETTPAHRIDYFESQGIKLDPNAETNDKLGKQLKRFTDWLKQMKRVSPNPTDLENDPAGELHVQNMAEFSNEQKDIVTEAMAEVLIKQGKPDQAIEIYKKLSFINPSKNAYFAAKIQELKAK